MKTGVTYLLQLVVVLAGLAVFVFLLVEPHLEGRNAHATLAQIYFHDPFLAYVYIGSVPFFLALRRAFTLGGLVRQDRARSPEGLAALRAIKRCGLALLGFVALGLVFVLAFGDQEDRPAGVFMGLLVAMVAAGIATGAARLARSLEAKVTPPSGSRA